LEDLGMKPSLGAIGATFAGWLGISSQLWAVGVAAPEIDATGALTGLAMLAGVLTLVAERKRRK
jgi:hypothetical protein